MVRPRFPLIAVALLGLGACQRQATGGLLPVRYPARVMAVTPEEVPVRRAVGALGASIPAQEIGLPTLERQLALAEERRAVARKPRAGTDSVAVNPVGSPSGGPLTSLADQLNLQGRLGPTVPPRSKSKDTLATHRPGPHQPASVESALAKLPDRQLRRAEKAHRWRDTGANLRSSLVILAAALSLMVLGLKL